MEKTIEKLEIINNRATLREGEPSGQLHSVADLRYTIELVTGEAEFAQMGDVWDELVRQTHVPVYMSYLWISLWWKHFGKHPKRKPYIITIYFYDQLVGIAPFYLSVSSIGGLSIEKRLKMMGIGANSNEFLGFFDDYGYSDFLDIIVHPKHREQVAGMLASLLIRNEINADEIDLNHIPDGSFVQNNLVVALQETGITVNKEISDFCPYMQVPESLSAYMKGLRSSVRRRFQQARKALSNKGALKVRDVANAGEIDKGLEELSKLHQFRWNKLGFPGLFFDKRFKSFLRDYAREAVKDNGIWLQLVEHNGVCCAARLALKDQDRYYDYISGFDDDSLSTRQRPGLGLMLKLTEEAIGQGFSTIEFLRGDEDYKYDFTGVARKNWHIQIQLVERLTPFQRLIRYILEWAGRGYMYVVHEWTLIRFHVIHSGPIKMPSSYLTFRWATVKHKLKKRKA